MPTHVKYQPLPARQIPYDDIEAGHVQIPVDPVGAPVATTLLRPDNLTDIHQPFTRREMLNLHAEVIAMQTRWGLSYKDAAHRLYLMEVQKLLAEKNAQTGMVNAQDWIDTMVDNKMLTPITQINHQFVDPKATR